MNRFQHFIQKLKEKCVCEFHVVFKVLNILILMASAVLLTAIGVGISSYKIYQFSKMDLWLWVGILYTLAILQIVTLTSETKIFSYDWANTVLMISGFSLVIVGLVFGAEFPPFQWQMTVYPMLGTVLCGFAYICNRAGKDGTD